MQAAKWVSDATELKTRLEQASDEAIPAILTAVIDVLGMGPGMALDHVENQVTWRMAHAFLQRPTPLAFEAWCARFPVTSVETETAWLSELRTLRIDHELRDDHTIESPTTALRVAMAITAGRIARPWAVPAVVAQETAILVHRYADEPEQVPEGCRLLADRIIHGWSQSLKDRAWTKHGIGRRFEEGAPALQPELNRQAWDQTRAVLATLDQPMSADIALGLADLQRLPKGEGNKFAHRTLDQEQGGWAHLATLTNDGELAQALLPLVGQLLPEAQEGYLLQWFERASSKGAVRVLDVLMTQTRVLAIDHLAPRVALPRLVTDEHMPWRAYVKAVALVSNGATVPVWPAHVGAWLTGWLHAQERQAHLHTQPVASVTRSRLRA